MLFFLFVWCHNLRDQRISFFNKKNNEYKHLSFWHVKKITTLCITVQCQHLQCLGVINNVKKSNKHVSETFVVNNYCLCNNVVTTHFMVVIVFRKGLQKLIYGDVCFINGNVHKN
jgi:hypothetical protein